MSSYQLYGTMKTNNSSMIPPHPLDVSSSSQQQQQQQQQQRRTSTTAPDGAFYDWRLHAPKAKSGWLQYLRWMIEGCTPNAEVSDNDRLANLQGLAKCLRLLRYYQQKFGTPPDDGGGTSHDQAMVLREVTRDLYEGACPSRRPELLLTVILALGATPLVSNLLQEGLMKYFISKLFAVGTRIHNDKSGGGFDG
jgi:hypothetical protein